MEQGPSRKANQFSASQEFRRIFMEPEGSLPHSQELADFPYPKDNTTVPYSNYCVIQYSHM